MSPVNPGAAASGSGRFDATRWTVICAAQGPEEPSRTEALETLCEAYWYPLYAYVRRRGYDSVEAEDLTQAFFQRFLEKDYLRAADQDKGRFRTFLLVAMKRFLANEWHRSQAQKRGGGVPHVPINTGWAEEMYHHEPVDIETPELLYERRWALLMLQRSLEEVRREMEQAGKGDLCESVMGALTGGSTEHTYAEIGSRFGMSEGAVKATVHRLRGRFRKHFLNLIEDTVRTEAEVDEEVDYLFSIFDP